MWARPGEFISLLIQVKLRLREMFEFECWVHDANQQRHVAGLLLPYVCKHMQIAIGFIENVCSLFVCLMVLPALFKSSRKLYVDLLVNVDMYASNGNQECVTNELVHLQVTRCCYE
jgi:hypothetical protein